MSPAARSTHPRGTEAVLVVGRRDGLAFEALHGRPLYLHAATSLVAALAGTEVPVTLLVSDGDHARVAAGWSGAVRASRGGGAVEVMTQQEWWSARSSRPAGALLVHDARCPLASAELLRSVLDQQLLAPEVSLATFRPVTDTVKTVDEGRIAGTIDRERLGALIVPTVVSGAVVGRALSEGAVPPLDDTAALVRWMRERGDVELVKGPSLARRVDDRSAVELLECVDELSRTVRH
ncbi:2-C-methyl-D-erythritol 4-phosphate cytidylyltransferase [Nocardioides kribbensis]|uniref:2-C-methyl-D-erythritol 4-phosphate cytidylyltransferase n=1 Tax=Nocardioides kribbensis TaxID=305517 RepID=UPI00187A52B6|nr:2-C-methyl-D-erythritol 4-phosphate cytidylyltransferase [Nocardioides kribbensis]